VDSNGTVFFSMGGGVKGTATRAAPRLLFDDTTKNLVDLEKNVPLIM
jgi:hypothetical protein